MSNGWLHFEEPEPVENGGTNDWSATTNHIHERITAVEQRLTAEMKNQKEFLDELLTKIERFSQVLVQHNQYRIVVMKYMPAIKEIHGFDAKTISAINENFKEILATLGEFIIYTDSVDMRKEELPEQGTVPDGPPDTN